MKFEIVIDGVVDGIEAENPRAAEDAFWIAFVRFCEANGWRFNGGTKAEYPPLTREQAIREAENAYPEHGKLRVVSCEEMRIPGLDIWCITVSNGERETSVAYPRLAKAERASADKITDP